MSSASVLRPRPLASLPWAKPPALARKDPSELRLGKSDEVRAWLPLLVEESVDESPAVVVEGPDVDIV